MNDLEGFVIRPAKPVGWQRRQAWQTAKNWGVTTKHFYTSREEAERDAENAKQLSGITFVVVEAIA